MLALATTIFVKGIFMKTKLISLLTCLAVNSYAVNTIISLPSSELSGFTVIRAEIATTTGIKSAEQNCNNVSYCNLTLPGLSLTPGMLMLQIMVKKLVVHQLKSLRILLAMKFIIFP